MALSPLGRGWAPLLEGAASALQGELGSTATQLDARVPILAQLLDQVAIWNRKVDLTAARSPEELVDLYLADALVLASSTSDTDWVDVGSGGGAPGVSLALLRPDLTLALVEPRAKRVAFLRNALSVLDMSTTRVVRGRSEDLESGTFAVAVSRATLPPPAWLEEGTRLARHAVWVLLAQSEPPARAGWRKDLDVHYHWPLTGVARRAVRYVSAQVS